MQLMFVYACLGQFYNWFHVLCMLGYQIFNLKFCSVFVLFGFLGKRLRTHNLAYACRLDYSHADLIIRSQSCSCVHMNLPRNLNFVLFVFAFIFTYNTPVQPLFHVSMFLSLCFTCLIASFVSHILELGFILCCFILMP